MRVLILADRSFAIRERALLSRLEVGLADEGVRVTHAVPRSVTVADAAAPTGEIFARRVTYEDRGPRLFRRARARQLVADLARGREGSPDPLVDVVHVFGEGAWELAAELAGLLEAGLAVEVWRADLVGPAARIRGAGDADERPGAPVVLFGATPPIEKLLREEVERAGAAGSGGKAVRAATWGVHTPARPHDLLDPGRVPSILLVGSARGPARIAAALQGVAAVTVATEPLVFADAEMCRRAAVWPLVNRLGLTARFTLVPEVEARRELTLRSDLVLLPEASGELRSFVLDAMAAGLVVMGPADPMVPLLIEGRTGRLIDRPAPDRWTAAIASVLADPGAARALAASARDYTRAHHRATAHVAAALDAYEWMTAEALPFRKPGGR